MKFKIVTDLDDVLVRSMPAFLDWLSKQLGKRVSIQDILSLNSDQFFAKYRISLNRALIDAQKEFFLYNGNLENLRPYPAKLAGLDCSIVTGREEKTRDVTEYWLKKHFKFNGPLYMTNWDTGPGYKKSDYVLGFKSDVYVDDNAQILAEIRARDHGRRTLLRLVNRPWNKKGSLRAIEDEFGITRVNGFQEAVYK